jgi:hypothetical protein
MDSNVDTQTSFTTREKKLMLKIARDTLFHYLNTSRTLDYDEDILPESLLGEGYGVFVSIHKGKALRGCLGVMHSKKSLYSLIQKQAIAASISDPRFKKVKFSELPQLCFEISVLSAMQKISSIEEIELGKHGIYMKSGNLSGTFLPQVATSTGWSLEEFLGYCAKDKLGLDWEAWKSAEIYVYTAEVFSENEC